MKRALLTTGIMLLSFSAHAGTLTLDFRTATGANSGSGLGNVRTFNVGGITITETAWGANSNSNTLQAAQLGLWSGYGLGVCNQQEAANCSSPNHQVSNENGTDFVLFQFSTAVNPISVTIRPYGTFDRDVTYFTGNAANNLNLSGTSLSGLGALGFSAAVNDDSSVSSSARTVSLISNSANSLLFGARSGGDANPDYFKIAGLTLDTIPPAAGGQTPEPATFGLIGSALVALALATKRLRKI